MESGDPWCGCHHRQLPPGFRFHPTDEELVVHYLKRKVDSAPLPVAIIAEVDLYKFDPWELPAKAPFGEEEWYFFSPRDRKYPNGARPNRAATSGYWKATGTDKPVLTSDSEGTQKVGVKKALVFYEGKPPKGIKTNWIMHEYRLADSKPTTTRPPAYNLDLDNKKGSLRLDDWVLCRIYKKKNTQPPVDHDVGESMNSMLGQQNPKLAALKASTYGGLMENENKVFDGIISNVNDGINNLAASGSNSKRTLPNLFWNDEGTGPPLLTKRFRTGNEDDNNNSVASFLGQLPQNQRAMMGSLGDGLLRQQYQVSGRKGIGTVRSVFRLIIFFNSDDGIASSDQKKEKK